MVSLEFLFT